MFTIKLRYLNYWANRCLLFTNHNNKASISKLLLNIHPLPTMTTMLSGNAWFCHGFAALQTLLRNKNHYNTTSCKNKSHTAAPQFHCIQVSCHSLNSYDPNFHTLFCWILYFHCMWVTHSYHSITPDVRTTHTPTHCFRCCAAAPQHCSITLNVRIKHTCVHTSLCCKAGMNKHDYIVRVSEFH